MSSVCATLFFLLPLAFAAHNEFVFNGFNGDAGWATDGSAAVLPNGVLTLAPTNSSISTSSYGHAFYSSPFQIRNLADGSIFSFSATFAFVILPRPSKYISFGDGIAFVLDPNTNFSTTSDDYAVGSFGLLGHNDNGKSSNHFFCIELDISHDKDFDDRDDNHVGIDINSMKSLQTSPAGYYTNEPFSDLHPLGLSSGKEMQVWIDYDNGLMQLNVSLSKIPNPKPKHPLLSRSINLSQVFPDHVYVGFS
jgi:hypothetical protein